MNTKRNSVSDGAASLVKKIGNGSKPATGGLHADAPPSPQPFPSLDSEETPVLQLSDEQKSDPEAVAKFVIDIFKGSERFKELTPDQQAEALSVIEAHTLITASANDPVFQKDGTIEMKLMDGRQIVISPANGYHSMQAKREMALFGEKGDHATMLPYYTMAAASKIDGEPVTMDDINSMSARDLQTLEAYFRRLNLI
jgi:hypothetical protein